jgi:hypothetical protein
MSTPGASDDWASSSVYNSDNGSNFTPFTTPIDDFEDTVQAPSNPYHVSLFPPNPQPQGGPYNYGSPELDFNSTPYGAAGPAPITTGMGFTSPYGNGPSYFDTPLTPVYSNGPAFDVHSSRPLHIGIDYTDDFAGTMQAPVIHSLQPQSRNPSISEISPMVTDQDIFHSPQQTVHLTNHQLSTNYTGMEGLPNDDFALFGASGDPSLVSTADLGAFDEMDLFNNMETEYSDSQLEHYVNL